VLLSASCDIRWCPALVALGLLIVTLTPGAANAQLAAGRSALESAEFGRAIRFFDRAERTERLDRDDLVALCEGRALARFAMGSATRARRDLQVLAALDPGHTFPVEAPPEVAAAFAEVSLASGGPLAAELTWAPAAGGTTLSVEVQHDGLSLVRSVRVHTRVGDGEWSEQEERRVTLEHAEGVVVAAYVELLGARGTVLVRQGTAEQPVVHGAPAAPVAVALPVSDELSGERLAVDLSEQTASGGAAQGSDDVGLAVGLGVGGAALLAAGIVLALVLGTQTNMQTQPSTPLVVDF